MNEEAKGCVEFTPEQAPDAYCKTYDGFEQEWLSTSALACLMTCGFAFKFKYIDRVREPVSMRAAFGISTHRGREKNLSQKIETKTDLPLSDVTDAVRDEVVHTFHQNEIEPGKEFDGKSKSHCQDIAVDKSVMMVEADYEVFQTRIAPQMVEKALAVRFPDVSRVLVGKLDVLDDDWVVRDLKTSSRAKGQAFADTNMGLTTYGMLCMCQFKTMPKGYLIENVIDAAKGVRTETYETGRDMSALYRQLMRFKQAAKVIDAGLFLPCDPSHWKCSPEWCGYWAQCPYGGGR